MKTRWENWVATLGQVTAEYQAERVWAKNEGVRLSFKLYIDFEGNDRFYVGVTDWNGDDVISPKWFGRFDKALEYLSDVNCEDYVGEKWEELRKDDLDGNS